MSSGNDRFEWRSWTVEAFFRNNGVITIQSSGRFFQSVFEKSGVFSRFFPNRDGFFDDLHIYSIIFFELFSVSEEPVDGFQDPHRPRHPRLDRAFRTVFLTAETPDAVRQIERRFAVDQPAQRQVGPQMPHGLGVRLE